MSGDTLLSRRPGSDSAGEYAWPLGSDSTGDDAGDSDTAGSMMATIGMVMTGMPSIMQSRTKRCGTVWGRSPRSCSPYSSSSNDK